MKHKLIILLSIFALLICQFSYGQGGKQLYERARKAFDKQDSVSAIDLLRKSAEKGYPEAQYNMGLYLSGKSKGSIPTLSFAVVSTTAFL